MGRAPGGEALLDRAPLSRAPDKDSQRPGFRNRRKIVERVYMSASGGGETPFSKKLPSHMWHELSHM